MTIPVTAWTATVQEDIEASESIFEMVLQEYSLRIYNTGDTLWLVAAWPEAGSIAFRLAFGMNSNFDKATVSEADGAVLITASTRLGDYRIVLSLPESPDAIFRYTTTFRARLQLLIPFWPRDIVPLTKYGRTENTAGIIHAHQAGTRSGQIFFSMTWPKAGSVLYFQNLTAMSPYCEATEVSLAETVGGSWPEIGFQFPVNPEKALPADKEFVISDAFVLLGKNIPSKDCDIAAQFLDYLAAIYLLLPKPDTEYHDWPSIAEKVLDDLHINKGCWTQTNGSPYLNAYVGDYATPSEIMVQLAVLLPLQEYLAWSGTRHQAFDDLNSGLKDFYNDKIGTIVRWHPALEDDLDKSEEQKREMVMDSWYLHHPLLNLSRMALRGSKTAKAIFLDSIDYAIKVARHFNYEWPVFYKMTTLEVLKAETSPGNGGEKDVPGSYAHIMLMAYKLTGEKRFLREADKALKSLEGLTFDIFYQANNTAFAAGALAELYKETGKPRYLELSYCCLAGIFKNCQIWDCNYGHAKNFPNFFSVFPLNDAPYTAAYEELEVFAALHHYLEVIAGIDILPSLKILIPEFIKYASGRLAFYYPPLLPEEMIAEEIKTGEIKKDLWIPLEDIHDGWEKSGEVGQEVYGAGLAFGIIPRHYFRLESVDALIFVDYPVTDFRSGKKSATFHIEGSPQLRAHMKLLGIPKSVLAKIKVEQKDKGIYRNVKLSSGQFDLAGSGMVRITWAAY
ncbi:hypothetical protein CLV94_0644 [Flavobacterium endophyticum]|uniref:Uncharacterized protein n=1 Tax=Flavobacterium endophyticum TaxID=1540163 RepID=A0A495MHZ4_9FLAO|nr:hypothetical protein [Flavobacterium endophyticum]RKS25607.1 hypothetical protein CLV94_0644 [Flavobacterium endophyticum]